jgi:hypothetical protein
MESGGIQNIKGIRGVQGIHVEGRLDRRLDMRFSRLGCTMPRGKGEYEEE